MSVVIGILIAQFVGKQLIKQVCSRFLALQLVLAIMNENRDMYPANLLMIMDGLSGTLKLNALPIDEIVATFVPDQKTRQALMPQDGLQQKWVFWQSIICTSILYYRGPLNCQADSYKRYNSRCVYCYNMVAFMHRASYS